MRSQHEYSGDALTTGIRRAIERQARVGGGISRGQAGMLLDHIDRLTSLLDAIITDGPEWDDEQWTVAIDAALPLMDGWTVRLRAPNRGLTRQSEVIG